MTDDHALRRVGLVAVHTSPLAQAGTGDAGGLNVYVDNVAHGLARRGVEVDVFTRRPAGDVSSTVEVEPRLRVHHNAAQTAQSGTADKDYKWYGLDLSKGKVRNSVQVRWAGKMGSPLQCDTRWGGDALNPQ